MRTIAVLILKYILVIALVLYVVDVSIKSPVVVLHILVISLLFGLFVVVADYLISKWMKW
jgi:uncharacterized membrane protein YvlD (DUF360 family)